MSVENPTETLHHISVKTLEEAVTDHLQAMEVLITSKKDAKPDDLYRIRQKLKAAFDVHTKAVPVPRLPYTMEEQDGQHRNEKTESHESFGAVSINRVSGYARLFGSEVQHQNYFKVSVRRAKRRLASGQEDIMAWDTPIVQFALSAAQFVDMITNQNSVSGVPCTITSVEGVQMDPAPKGLGSEFEYAKGLFSENVAKAREDVESHQKQAENLLEKKSLSQADKKSLLAIFNTTRSVLVNTAPWIAGLLHEHAEKVVTKSKIEIDAFISLAIHKAGIRAIRDSDGVLLMGSGDSDENA